MQEKLFKDLENLGHKFSKIEEEIGCPKNYLSRFKNPENVLPQKWVQPLQDYIEKNQPKKPMAPAIDINEKRTELVVDSTGLKEKPAKKLVAAVSETNDKINKDYGPGTVMRWGDKPDTDLEVISTGSLNLDRALGIGGLPRGRMVEIFGLESSGKSTLTLHIIANAQKKGLRCLLVDAENSFDPEYADALGVNVDELEYCQPSYGEQGFEVADRKIISGEVGVVIIDSVAAMIPKAELEGEMGDSKMGLHARLMSQVCRKMVGSVAKQNVLCIFINQIRNKIGVIYGSPEVTTGGMALQFYASIRLAVSRSTTNENSVMNGQTKEGNQTTVKVVKNKCAPPFRSAKFNIIYGKGVDRFSEIIDIAIEENIIKKGGSWFSYNDSQIGQGRPAVVQFLQDNPEVLKEIEAKILSKDQ
jgi:recombination protein RecA